MSPDQIPIYTPEYSRCPQLNGTPHVRRVSSGLVAKFFTMYEYNIDEVGDSEEGRKENEEARRYGIQKLENEYLMLKAVYDAGVSVPKPEGIFFVPVLRRGKLNYLRKRKFLAPGILMQYIEGIPLNRLRGKRLSEVADLHHKEVRKCKIAGFDPRDTLDRNAIYNPLENKVYLVDVEN